MNFASSSRHLPIRLPWKAVQRVCGSRSGSPSLSWWLSREKAPRVQPQLHCNVARVARAQLQTTCRLIFRFPADHLLLLRHSLVWGPRLRDGTVISANRQPRCNTAAVHLFIVFSIPLHSPALQSSHSARLTGHMATQRGEQRRLRRRLSGRHWGE